MQFDGELPGVKDIDVPNRRSVGDGQVLPHRGSLLRRHWSGARDDAQADARAFRGRRSRQAESVTEVTDALGSEYGSSRATLIAVGNQLTRGFSCPAGQGNDTGGYSASGRTLILSYPDSNMVLTFTRQ